MLKTLLVGINAKFIHSNLAIRYLKQYTEKRTEYPVQISEYTINQQPELILREILKLSPDVLGFSCYIWNFELIKKLIVELKKLLPDTIIFLGGPEVSYNSSSLLRKYPVDAILCGEGEEIFCQFLTALQQSKAYTHIYGITYRSNNQITENSPMPPINMDDIPFVYQNFNDLENRIVYYEASRGCPFRCQYCLSCGTNGVRFRSLPLVLKDLKFFLDAKVRQVKFVDRTFNCDKKYAMAIWQFLNQHDNGITNFHFEIAAELIDSNMTAFLQTIRKGLFQFEIGIQSTNKETLKAIKRVTLPEKLTPTIHGLQQKNNIHLHLDLIAGLPYETYEAFRSSYNYVYSLSPDQLQLGFLKLLKGSGLYENNHQYQITCTDYAPYEVLKTPWLSHQEILRLKMVEEMTETYYNSNRYQKTLEYLLTFFPTPFDLFQALGDFYETNQLHLAPHSKVEYYTILRNFFLTLKQGDETHFQWCVRYDCYSHEKAKKLPEWLTVEKISQYKNKIYDFIDMRENVEKLLPEYAEFDTKQIIRNAHIDVFPFHPVSLKSGDTAVLFNYRRCDLLGNAHATIISL